MTENTEVLARIVAPHFVCGILIADGRVSATAPIVRYMLGWSPQRVLSYCNHKGWEIARVPSTTM